MQFAVALIEYLISGVIASIWLLTLTNHYLPLPIETIKANKEIFLAIYLPLIYTLGIYIDATASYLVRQTKHLDQIAREKSKKYTKITETVRDLFSLISGKPKKDSYQNSAKILIHSMPDAIRTMEAYISRDRIARGMAVNSLIGAIVALNYATESIQKPAAIACVISLVISILIYTRLRRLSSRFKQAIISELKNQSDSKASEPKKP